MRRELLKAYLFALLSEGEFRGLKSPAALIKKAMAAFAQDLPAVIGELAQMAAEQAGNKFTAITIGKLNEFIADVGARGFKAAWGSVQAQYARGVENIRGKGER